MSEPSIKRSRAEDEEVGCVVVICGYDSPLFENIDFARTFLEVPRKLIWKLDPYCEVDEVGFDCLAGQIADKMSEIAFWSKKDPPEKGPFNDENLTEEELKLFDQIKVVEKKPTDAQWTRVVVQCRME
jgi:hypothetical protein